MATDNQYRLILGTFIDNKFVWHDVDSFATLSEAYKEYKKYVNEQLKYTDEELVKVWNTGRLDIELLQGRRLLNWTGIYVREAAPDDDDDEDEDDDEVPEKEPAKPKDSAERVWRTEDGDQVTESELRAEFEFLKERLPDEYNFDFEEYIDRCEENKAIY